MRLASAFHASLLGVLLCTALHAASPSPGGTHSPLPASESERRAAEALLSALDNVVRIKVSAVSNARSARTLGREREGSAVLLAPSGLVLTIGYLILEADSIELADNAGRIVSATVVAYDHASGFGLVKPAAPLTAKGIAIGSSTRVSEFDKLIFATHGGKAEASVATVASKRRFAGYWEYLIDDAIFTIPPRSDHSGAALINRDGELVGIGSLIVADAAAQNRRAPGNMFVPIDLLKPILHDMTHAGRTKDSLRPWIGLSTQEVDGRLRVIRVQEDAPAAQAGLKPGDIILAVRGEGVRSLEEFYGKLWSMGEAGVVVPLRVLQGSEVREINVQSIDRMDYVRTKQAL